MRALLGVLWLLAGVALPAGAQEWAGVVKSAQGAATIERAGKAQGSVVVSMLRGVAAMVSGLSS